MPKRKEISEPYNYRGMIYNGLVKRYKETGAVFDPNVIKSATTKKVDPANIQLKADPNYEKRNTLTGYLADFFIGVPLEMGTAPLEVISGDIINWESKTDIGEKAINIGEGVAKAATDIVGVAASTAFTGSPYPYLALKQAGKSAYKGFGGKGPLEIEGVSTKYQVEDPGTKKIGKIVEDVIPMAYSFGTSKAAEKAAETGIETATEEVAEETAETLLEKGTEEVAETLVDDPDKKASFLKDLYTKVKGSEFYKGFKKAEKYAKKGQKYYDIAASGGQEKINEYVRNLEEQRQVERKEELTEDVVTWKLPTAIETEEEEQIIEEPILDENIMMAKQGGMIAKKLQEGTDVGGNLFSPIQDRNRLIPQQIMSGGGLVGKYQDSGGVFDWANTAMTDVEGMVDEPLEFYSTAEGSFIGDQMIMSMEEIDAAMEAGTLEETFGEKVAAYEELQAPTEKEQDPSMAPKVEPLPFKEEEVDIPETDISGGLLPSARYGAPPPTEGPTSQHTYSNPQTDYLKSLQKGIGLYSSIHSAVGKKGEKGSGTGGTGNLEATQTTPPGGVILPQRMYAQKPEEEEVITAKGGGMIHDKLYQDEGKVTADIPVPEGEESNKEILKNVAEFGAKETVLHRILSTGLGLTGAAASTVAGMLLPYEAGAGSSTVGSSTVGSYSSETGEYTGGAFSNTPPLSLSAEEKDNLSTEISSIMAPKIEPQKEGTTVSSNPMSTASFDIDEFIDVSSSGNVPIHAEGGESIAKIDGNNLEIKGPSHKLDAYGNPTEEGGVRLAANEGDWVYSKKFSKSHIKRVKDLNKMIEIASDADESELVTMLEKIQV